MVFHIYIYALIINNSHQPQQSLKTFSDLHHHENRYHRSRIRRRNHRRSPKTLPRLNPLRQIQRTLHKPPTLKRNRGNFPMRPNPNETQRRNRLLSNPQLNRNNPNSNYKLSSKTSNNNQIHSSLRNNRQPRKKIPFQIRLQPRIPKRKTRLRRYEKHR